MRINVSLLALAVSLLGLHPASGQITYDTDFISAGALATNYVSGNFSASFSGVRLYVNTTDIGNIDEGTMSLTFSQPVKTISFDVGGMDAYWGDTLVFGLAPALGTAENTTASYLKAVTLTGTTLTGTDFGSGARLTFSDLPGVTSFTWTDAGTSPGSDYVFYNNFAFTTVPEPSPFILTSIGGLALLILFRKHR